LEAIAMKWKFVLAFRIAPHTAMPTALPKFRVMLNKPLAYFSLPDGRLPRPKLTLGDICYVNGIVPVEEVHLVMMPGPSPILIPVAGFGHR
jgi:hypothetical protein